MQSNPIILLALVAVTLMACGISTPAPAAPATEQGQGAFVTNHYPNLFGELLGKGDAEIQAKVDAAWQQLIYGDDATQRIYYPVGNHMAYIQDIGNNDVRSEGMSYGMMIAVQMDKQAEFDRLWRWAKTYMYRENPPYQGYFAWHCTVDGEQIDTNPASDGEEWFAMALFFASARWGDGEGIFHYKQEAQAILDAMLRERSGSVDTPMFDLTAKQVVFVPRLGLNSFTDPSYHLPAYYELWARWADKDNQFWAEAAQASRAFFPKTVHPTTGLMPDYAEFDGRPRADSEHDYYRFDAWRTAANIAIDYRWFARDPWPIEQSNRLLDFFAKEGVGAYANQYTLDGKARSTDHSPGHVAMNAVAALAATTEQRTAFVEELWNMPIPSGKWRYYDGMLYLLGLLHVSGNFRIYTPN